MVTIKFLITYVVHIMVYILFLLGNTITDNKAAETLYCLPYAIN